MIQPARSVNPARARGFDAWAPDYDRYRPGYPRDLFSTIVERLMLPERPTVADLGAGTGRASLAMAALGWHVTAVEPGAPMLDVLRERAAADGLEVGTVQASAEETGMKPESVDLVTAAQAFHWFNKDRALEEMARIIRGGGGVALFWNVRDTASSAFLADYDALLRRNVAGSVSGRYEADPPNETLWAIEAHEAEFDAPKLIQFHHTVPMTNEEFAGMAFTASYVRVDKSPEEQELFRHELDALLARHHPDGDRPFDVPYRTDLWIARRSGA
jgi:SAM-dependent methyltransferase